MQRTDDVLVLVGEKRHLATAPTGGSRRAWCGAPLGNETYFAGWLWEPQLDETCKECDASDFPGIEVGDEELQAAVAGLISQLRNEHDRDLHEHAGGMDWCRCGLPYRDCEGCVLVENLDFVTGNLCGLAETFNDYLEFAGKA